MARAYAYAEGDGPLPRPLKLSRAIDRFGPGAVLGRVLSYQEISAVLTVEHIVEAHRARAASGDWADWARQHPEANRLLTAAAKEHGDVNRD